MTSDIRHTEIYKLFCAFGTARNLSAPGNETATPEKRGSHMRVPILPFPEGHLIGGAPELKFRAKRNELTSFFRKRLTNRDFDANYEGSRTAPAFDFDSNPTSLPFPDHRERHLVTQREPEHSAWKGIRLSHFLGHSPGLRSRRSDLRQKKAPTIGGKWGLLEAIGTYRLRTGFDDDKTPATSTTTLPRVSPKHNPKSRLVKILLRALRGYVLRVAAHGDWPSPFPASSSASLGSPAPVSMNAPSPEPQMRGLVSPDADVAEGIHGSQPSSREGTRGMRQR